MKQYSLTIGSILANLDRNYWIAIKDYKNSKSVALEVHPNPIEEPYPSVLLSKKDLILLKICIDELLAQDISDNKTNEEKENDEES